MSGGSPPTKTLREYVSAPEKTVLLALLVWLELVDELNGLGVLEVLLILTVDGLPENVNVLISTRVWSGSHF